MAYSPCLLIPLYNHWHTIRAMVERLSAYKLPIFIIDDGSDEVTQAVLEKVAEEFPLVRKHRLSVNQGKGAAVMHGMREAFKAGFTHALQIDADGQHDTNDVPRFIEAGARRQEAVICGKPIYDSSVPKKRLYGRYITHFWVHVETLGFSVGDSMCGFRLYPLTATCALINRVSIPARMAFDIEVIVRLLWRGVPCENLTTKVIYPEGGISHFDMLWDNVRISMMHTCLFFGMLIRLPVLLGRKLPGGKNFNQHWARIAERGSIWGLRFVFCSYRLLGKRVAELMLYPVIGYFFLTGKAARQASLDYLQHVYHYQAKHPVLPGWKESFMHMMAFGRSALDKLSAWMGNMGSVSIEFPDQKIYESLVDSGRGALLIGSHLGNLELTRALATHEKHAKVNAVVYTGHAQRFNSLLEEANADFGVNLIQVSSLGPDIAILLKEKIDRGELVVIVGDRTPPLNEASERISRVDFLGEPAPFAQGPFILASLLDCPVYLFFCLYEKDRYRIYMEPFADQINLPRENRGESLRAYVGQYAQRLEYYCLKAPLQWFNFYDFWKKETLLSEDKTKG